MIYLKRIWGSRFVKALLAIWYLMAYITMAFYLVSLPLGSNTATTSSSSWFLNVALLGVFLYPFLLPEFFGTTGQGAEWGIRTYKWIHASTVLITGFSGVAWYAYPDNKYLEPATFLLGLAAASIIYNRDKYLKAVDATTKAIQL